MLRITRPDTALLFFSPQMQRQEIKLLEIFNVGVARCHLEDSILVFLAVRLRPEDTNASKHACVFMLKERRIIFTRSFTKNHRAFFQNFQHLHF